MPPFLCCGLRLSGELETCLLIFRLGGDLLLLLLRLLYPFLLLFLAGGLGDGLPRRAGGPPRLGGGDRERDGDGRPRLLGGGGELDALRRLLLRLAGGGDLDEDLDGDLRNGGRRPRGGDDDCLLRRRCGGDGEAFLRYDPLRRGGDLDLDGDGDGRPRRVGGDGLRLLLIGGDGLLLLLALPLTDGFRV